MLSECVCIFPLLYENTHLAGVITSAKTPKGSSASLCSIGRANAAVLPLPVLAHPMQLRPGEKKTIIY